MSKKTFKNIMQQKHNYYAKMHIVDSLTTEY